MNHVLQLESPFAINQPHDLMAFMKQETTYEKMLVRSLLNFCADRWIAAPQDRESEIGTIAAVFHS